MALSAKLPSNKRPSFKQQFGNQSSWKSNLDILDESCPEDDLYLSDLAGYNPDFRKNSYDLGEMIKIFHSLKSILAIKFGEIDFSGFDFDVKFD